MDASPILANRFWKKVPKNHTNNCWKWGGTIMVNGYGTLTIRPNKYYAHRASWMINRGPIPDGLHVLHKCDNPPCVNPEHLFLGTQRDNNNDKIRKGRARGGSMKGESHPLVKMTNGKIKEIRARYKAGGITQGDLASQYGMSQPGVSAIITGRLWKHVV